MHLKSFLLSALMLVAAPAGAFDLTAMTDAEREAFGAEVRAYLLLHPEILVEVSNALDAQNAAKQADADKGLIAANAAAIFSDGNSFVGGNPNGDITVVEFLDYRCGYCRKAHNEVAALVSSDTNIRYVVKEFPILGEDSVIASRFAIAARKVAGDEAYKKINAGFYETFRGEVTAENLAAFANGLGIDPAPILAAMNDDDVTQIISSNHALAQALSVSGTPTFVIGGQMLRGYAPLEHMQGMVQDERS